MFGKKYLIFAFATLCFTSMLFSPIAKSVSSAKASSFSSSFEEAMHYLVRGGYVPKAADSAVKALDKEMMKLLGETYSRSSLRIAFTVPVSLNDFQKTNALSRQMSEELARALKQKGYRVIEMRQGTEIVMTPEVGEFFLTREQERLTKKEVVTELLLTGTYLVTSRGVRYSLRLLHMGSTEVIAMATTTVPVHTEIMPLLIENGDIPLPPLAPTVGTRLTLPPGSPVLYQIAPEQAQQLLQQQILENQRLQNELLQQQILHNQALANQIVEENVEEVEEGTQNTTQETVVSDTPVVEPPAPAMQGRGVQMYQEELQK